MSMSEFEEHAEQEDREAVSLGGRKVILPADFSEEELAFAQELNALFSLPEEDLPPYFVQTLLEPHDPRFLPADPRFEERTRVRVFQRLRLQRRLFPERPRGWQGLVNGVTFSRRLLMVGVSLLLFMVLTMAITAPSFASGLVILLRGTQSGVYPVQGPLTRPVITSPLNSPGSQEDEVNLLSVQQQLKFPLYWPQDPPAHYNLSNIYLYSQHVSGWPVWTDGPMLEFRYTSSASTGSGRDVDQFAIREFKPRGLVYQLVEAGAIHLLQVDASGQAGAIYIDGQWVTINKYSHHWLYNGHCELLTQRDGVVFWLAGECDQHSGLTVQSLLSIAASLQVVHLDRLMHTGVTMDYVTVLDHYVPGPFDGIILSLSQENGLDSSYLRLVGPDQPPPSPEKAPLQKHPHQGR
jgi:hypothetical protein